jgi:hypothetical protein
MLKEICMQGKRALNLWNDTTERRDSLAFSLCSVFPLLNKLSAKQLKGTLFSQGSA